MSNLHQARRRLIATIIALGVLDVIALILLLSPLVSSPRAQQEEVNRLQEEVQKKVRVVIPPNQVQARIVQARQQIDGFYKERLPAQSSAIVAELGKLAAANQITLTQATYRAPKDSGVPDLRLVSIDASLLGNYLQEVKFINALERSHLFFLVDSVTLGEQKGGTVRLQLKLETYLKGQA